MNPSEKPVKEWLEMLIEPYRTQALANWNVSIEGADYWNDLQIKISNRSEKYIFISSEPQYSPF